MKRFPSHSRTSLLVGSLLAAAALSGCAVVPYDPGYAGYGGYYGEPVYAPAPVYVAPSVNFGFGYRSGGGHYGHHHRW